MKCAAGVGGSLLHGIVGKEVRDCGDQACVAESLFDIVALEIDIGIDFVGDPVVALIAFEADVVGGGADPQSLAIDLERRFPDAQMIARSDEDRKSTRLNSSHLVISYAVFCLKKKKKIL